MRHQKFGFATIVVTVAVFLVAIAFEHWANPSLASPLKNVLSLVLLVVEGGLLLWSLYQVVVSLAGLMPKRLRLHPGFVHPRILCITAAHNEQAVIAEHIKSLQQMTYPNKRVDIAILADNCTDDTARIARRMGVKVWERTNETLKGKGHALRWAFENRVSLLKYDGVCIFDADNLVDPNFLHVMASHLNRGDVAIQAYLDTKNPWDSWITASYASAYWFMNRLWQRSRAMLGLSGAIGGTGFCVSTRILERIPWEATTLTEDLEYTVRLTMEGYRVHWTDETHVYDEKPVTYDATVLQRRCWMQGHWLASMRYSRALLRQAATSSGHARWRALDMLLYLWQPVFVLLTGFNLIVSVMQTVFGTDWFHPWIPSGIWTCMTVAGFSLPLIAFAMERVGWKALLYYPLYLFFNITWVPISVEGIRHVNDSQWVHTLHNRALSMDEVQTRRNADVGRHRAAADTSVARRSGGW